MRNKHFPKLSAIISCVLFVILCGLNAIETRGQSFDYGSYPKLDFNLVDLELNLGIQPQNLRIDGEATYTIKANISGADTLTMYASHLDISTVSVDGETVDFSLYNDSLFVPVDDSSEAGNQYDVRVRYSGQPQFGLLKNSHGSVWTSLLPKSQRHWVPIIDNPHVELRTRFNISVPSGYQVWAPGEKTDEEVLSVDAMRYRFESANDIPASALAFAVGAFSQSASSSATPKINVAVEKVLADSIDKQKVLESTREYLRRIADQLAFEYPYPSLQVVVLGDHNWEIKNWGASTVFVYANGGDFQTQLLRGITGQWFGVHQREQQWSEADAVTLYQTLLLQTIAEKTYRLQTIDWIQQEYPSTVYEKFGYKQWNDWQKGITSWKTASIRSHISASMKHLSKLSGAFRWEDYADFWYRKIGQPLFESPRFSFDSTPSKSASKDSIAYEVYYDLNEPEGELKLRFEATHGSYNELTTITAYEIYRNDTDTSEVTFTGSEDSVMLQVDPTIRTLKLDYKGYPNLTLEEYKPSSFLIHDLRTAQTVEERAKAARKLGYHSDNPDLQLAIKDFLKQDLSPIVQAALLQSLGDITGGAAGTEQTFLDALGSEYPAIREAALMSMQHYPGNRAVINRVESEARNADDSAYFRKATRVLTAIASQDEFIGFVESVVKADTVGEKSIIAIRELANVGGVDQAVEQAELFVDKAYRFGIRRAALNILIQHSHASADWLTRAKELLREADPRIRFLVIRGLERNMNEDIRAFLSDYVQDEYDARVHKKIMDIL